MRHKMPDSSPSAASLQLSHEIRVEDIEFPLFPRSFLLHTRPFDQQTCSYGNMQVCTENRCTRTQGNGQRPRGEACRTGVCFSRRDEPPLTSSMPVAIGEDLSSLRHPDVIRFGRELPSS
jgi:hypothetical protein